MSGATWDRAMGNAKGSYLLCASAARIMRHNGLPTNGHLIMFSDWAAGATPYTGYLPYLTAKAAVGIHDQGVCGGVWRRIASWLTLLRRVPRCGLPKSVKRVGTKDVLAKAPLRRESSADEIAEVVAMLLKSETITGETIRVDSGRHIAGPGVVDDGR